MEWLKTLVWIFRGGEKETIAFIAAVTLLAVLLPVERPAQDGGQAVAPETRRDLTDGGGNRKQAE